MRIVKKLQNGGNMADPAAAQMNQPAEQDPMVQIINAFAEGLQSQNCELLAQGAQMFLQLVQQTEAGAEGQPVFAKGGKLANRKPASVKLVRG